MPVTTAAVSTLPTTFPCLEYMERKLRIIDTSRPHVWLMTGMSDFSDWKP
ncbi:hypothetical protein NIB75_17230 [Bacteroides uniformis]|nr:hypothetical protein [Bacteroides uniformis]